jgi:hypothetical protein
MRDVKKANGARVSTCSRLWDERRIFRCCVVHWNISQLLSPGSIYASSLLWPAAAHRQVGHAHCCSFHPNTCPAGYWIEDSWLHFHLLSLSFLFPCSTELRCYNQLVHVSFLYLVLCCFAIDLSRAARFPWTGGLWTTRPIEWLDRRYSDDWDHAYVAYYSEVWWWWATANETKFLNTVT